MVYSELVSYRTYQKNKTKQKTFIPGSSSWLEIIIERLLKVSSLEKQTNLRERFLDSGSEATIGQVPHNYRTSRQLHSD
jgi:hypothetical protein